jgi:hexosaminidase
MKTTYLILACTILLGSCISRKDPGQSGEAFQVIPTPLSVHEGAGTYHITTSTRICYLAGDTADALPELAVRLSQALGKALPEPPGVVPYDVHHPPAGEHGILLALDSSVKHDEGYLLEIGRKGVDLKARTPAGLFYGIQTLRQMLPRENKDPGDGVTLPCLTIEDEPRFEWRGMHLDVARHFFPADSIKRFLDALAMHKMNRFHWHLTDDQGWRIEIEKYPALTEVGAWREDTRERAWSYDQFPVVEGKPVYGGYYTREEIREIVKYARERFITIVPEIDIPGHSWAALYAYPNLSCSGKPYFHSPSDPFSFTDPFCAGNSGTYRLLEDVFSEVMDLFPSRYIHLGGDEAKKTPWEHCEKCQKLMKEEGLEDEGQLQSYFIDRIGRFIMSKGRDYIGWDEILEGGLPEGAAVMSWRGEKGGIEAARMGHPVVMVPSHTLYFNSAQFDPGQDGPGRRSITSLKDVFMYQPVPEELGSDESSMIMGVQGCIWTENTQTWHKVEEHLFPRLLALSENAWNPAATKDFNEFRQRVNRHYTLLDEGGFHYFIPPPRGLKGSNLFLAGKPARIRLENPLGYGRVVYTLDGSVPGPGSHEYSQELIIREACTIRSAIILPSGKMGVVMNSQVSFMEPLDPEIIDGSAFSTGLGYRYMEGTITSLDQIDGLTTIKDGIVKMPLIISERAEDNFAIEYEGYIRVDDVDIYTFRLASDDGSRLYIGDTLVVDADGIHAPRPVTGQVALAPGYYPLKIQFFDGNYGEELEVTAESSKGGRLELSGMLYHSPKQ